MPPRVLKLRFSRRRQRDRLPRAERQRQRKPHNAFDAGLYDFPLVPWKTAEAGFRAVAENGLDLTSFSDGRFFFLADLPGLRAARRPGWVLKLERGEWAQAEDADAGDDDGEGPEDGDGEEGGGARAAPLDPWYLLEHNSAVWKARSDCPEGGEILVQLPVHGTREDYSDAGAAELLLFGRRGNLVPLAVHARDMRPGYGAAILCVTRDGAG